MRGDFTQKEILIKLMDKMDAVANTLQTHTTELQGIKEQTTKTNGRVFKLEDRVDLIDKEQGRIGVKIGMAATILAVVVTEAIRRLL